MPKHSWEASYRKTITTRRPSAGAKILRAALFLPSWILQAWMLFRNWAYERNIFEVHKSSIPVISIGNLSVGGTGKTPVTLFIGKQLSEKHKVAILSRGYRSPAEKSPAPQILSIGEGPILPAEDTGDEAYLLASEIPEAIVIVGRDRVASARLAVELGADVILMDDGMQHRRLYRDLDIVVMDAKDPLGCGYCLPRGLLREPPSSLKRAQVIILTHCEPCQKGGIAELIKPYTEATLISTQFQVAGARSKNDEVHDDLMGMKVGVFAGVAQPDRVRRNVCQLGATVLRQESLGDHCTMSPAELRALSQSLKAQGANYLVCTQKDFVKMTDKHHRASVLPILWIERELLMDSDEKTLMNQSLETVFA